MIKIKSESPVDWQIADMWFLEKKGKLPDVSAREFQELCECVGNLNWLGLWCMAIIETGYFSSTIFKQKKNLFGLAAVDKNPLGEAASFETIHDAVLAGVQHLAVYAGHHDFEKKPQGQFVLQRTSDIRKWGFFGIVEYFNQLGGKDINGRVKWASNPNHGKQIASLYEEILTFSKKKLNKLEDDKNNEAKSKLKKTLVAGSFKIGIPLLIKAFPWLGWVSFGLYALSDYVVSLF